MCWSHLDTNGRTADAHLEIQNFQKAGEILASVWSGTKIDGFEVVAEFKKSSSRASSFFLHQAALINRRFLC